MFNIRTLKKETWLAILLVVSLIAIDQISKLAIEAWLLGLPGNIQVVIPNFFNFRLAYNTGGGWSIFAENTWLLFAASTLMIVGLVWWYTKNEFWFTRLTLLILIAGAIGNWIDRALYLHVIDFLQFFPFGYPFPVFNFADMCISVGTAAFMVDTFIEPRRKSHD